MKERRGTIFAAFALLLGTVLLYWPAMGYDFIGLDDPDYVTQNGFLNQGLGWPGVAWVFQTGYVSNWHPLTWLSHIVDFQLYGLKPGGHHLTNLVFHVANTLLLFGLLKRMTRSLWPSAAVAALFAWHPLHVESVAWIAERKDVLSAFFFFLAIWAYLGNLEKRGGARVLNYILVLLFFSCGLMAKPMVVTLPFVLLLLDFWPLGRFSANSFLTPSSVAQVSEPAPRETCRRRLAPFLKTLRPLLIEKIPLFLLVLPSCVITVMAQSHGHSVNSLEEVSLGNRLLNVLAAYGWYVEKLVWPADLGLLYPLQRGFSIWTIAGCGGLVVLLSGLALRYWRQRPYLLLGWLWFLGTLVPVIGLVQVGNQSWADRYSYIPSIGLFIAICWTLREGGARFRWRARMLAGMSAAVLLVLATICARQLHYWQNSESLFRHTLAVTDKNFVIQTALGICLEDQKQVPEAQACYEESIRINPHYYLGQSRLGSLFLDEGKTEEAEARFRASIEALPDQFEARMNLGGLLLQKNLPAEAAEQFAAGVRAKPLHPAGHYLFGKALAAQGRLEEACVELSESLRLQPQNPEAADLLARATALQQKRQSPLGFP